MLTNPAGATLHHYPNLGIADHSGDIPSIRQSKIAISRKKKTNVNLSLTLKVSCRIVLRTYWLKLRT